MFGGDGSFDKELVRSLSQLLQSVYIFQVFRSEPFIGAERWSEAPQVRIMATTSIGSSLTSDITQSTATARAAKLFAAMDTNQNGEISRSEFKAFGENTKVPGAARQPPSGGAQLPSVDTLFSSTDTNASQSLSVSELSSMLAEGETRAKTAGAQGGPPSGGGGMHGSGGAKPAGGGGGGLTESSTSSSSSSSSANTDPADANQDGTVSATEQVMYELSHPNAAETK